MNKMFSLVMVFALVFAIAAIPNSQAFAIPMLTTTEEGNQSSLAWTWDNPAAVASEVKVDLSAAPAPTWLQLSSTGLNISVPANICYPFRNGQFGWVGEIRQWINGNWKPLYTTVARPNPESAYQACAKAPAAGKYALFSYYSGKPEIPVLQQTETVCENPNPDWNMFFVGEVAPGDPNNYFMVWFHSGVPGNTPVTYTVTSHPNFTMANPSGSAVTTTYGSGSQVTFMGSPFTSPDWQAGWTVDVTVQVPSLGLSGCFVMSNISAN